MANPQLPTITPRYVLETRRYLALSVGIGLVVVLVVFVGIIPQVQAILNLQRETSGQQQQVTKLEQKVRQFEQVLNPEILAQIQTVDILLPSQKPLLGLLASLDSVANLSGVSYSGIELTPGSIATESAELEANGFVATTPRASVATGGSTDADSLDVRLRVNGTLEQLNQFLALIERTAPISTVISLSLTPQGRPVLLSTDSPETVTGQYEAEVTVAAAYFTRSVSAAVDAALPTINSNQQEFLNELAQFTVQEVPPQLEIMQGGLDDLFGVEQPPTGVKN